MNSKYGIKLYNLICLFDGVLKLIIWKEVIYLLCFKKFICFSNGNHSFFGVIDFNEKFVGWIWIMGFLLQIFVV